MEVLRMFIKGLTKEIKEIKNKKTPPTIVEHIETVTTGTKKGATIKMENTKSIKIIVDGTIIPIKDISKIFPMKYANFYVQETFKSNHKGQLNKENIIYIPRAMAVEHSVTVTYRIKMDLYIINIVSQ